MSCLIILPFLVNPVLAQNWFFCENIRVFFYEPQRHRGHKGKKRAKD
jgi:hypothetical protein